jgi:gliding motility-associated-like protein
MCNSIKFLSFIFFILLTQYSFTQTLLNNGGFITAQPGSYTYVNGNVQNDNTGILAVNGNGTATSAELYVTQDITNNATINADGYIKLLRHWYDNNVFNSTTGTVFFLGPNEFLGGTSTTQFFNLTLAGTGIKTQQVNKIVKGVLDLTSIHLNTDIYGCFVTNTALNSVIRTTGFVSSANGGFLSRNTLSNGLYMFPVGSTANTSQNIPGSGTFRYRPVEITPTNATANTYTVRLANLDATNETPVGYNRNSFEPTLCASNPDFYHQINRTNGTSAINLTINYEPVADGNWSDMARWNISQPAIWQDIPVVTVTPGAPFFKSTTSNWNDFTNIPYILSNTNPTQPIINNINTTGCTPLDVVLSSNATAGITYTWLANGLNIGNGSNLPTVFSNPGCYDITLSASNGACSSSVTSTSLICVENTPNAAFTASTSVISNSNQSVNFYNSSADATDYFWDFGNGTTSNQENPSIIYSNPQSNYLVSLIATSPNGCSDEVTMVINYNEEAIFYVPNSFTPDEDEFNQSWGPVFTSGFDPYNFDLFLFNRWGEVIWESHDASARWDGTYGNKSMHCPDGVYTWKISFKPKNTDDKTIVTGSLNLIR